MDIAARRSRLRVVRAVQEGEEAFNRGWMVSRSVGVYQIQIDARW